VKSIDHCSIEGCGLRIGYRLADGSEICWLHAEARKLDVHRDWLREHTPRDPPPKRA